MKSLKQQPSFSNCAELNTFLLDDIIVIFMQLTFGNEICIASSNFNNFKCEKKHENSFKKIYQL